MKKNLTELVFIIDRSGSMYPLAKDTVGGYNSFLDKQRDEGEVLVSTVLFNDHSSVVHDRVPLQNVKPMTVKDYVPTGCTALLDAVGDAIHHIALVHKYIREEDKPEKTIMVITTDGMENASRKFTYDRLKKEIESKKEQGWEFLFLGANIDAIETAGRFGISEDRASNYVCDSEGVELQYKAVGEAVKMMRAEAMPLSSAWKAKLEKDCERVK